MKRTLFAMAILSLLAAVAQARPIDWQAELDRCRAMREQIQPLLLAGVGVSAVARSGTALRRCIWIELIAAQNLISNLNILDRCLAECAVGIDACNNFGSGDEATRGTTLPA